MNDNNVDGIFHPWLIFIATEIKQGKTTISAACQRCIFTDNGQYYIRKVHRNQLSKALKKANLINYSVGRKGKELYVDPEMINEILDLYCELKCGITAMWEYVNKEQVW